MIEKEMSTPPCFLDLEADCKRDCTLYPYVETAVHYYAFKENITETKLITELRERLSASSELERTKLLMRRFQSMDQEGHVDECYNFKNFNK